jgi:hypothetical protein
VIVVISVDLSNDGQLILLVGQCFSVSQGELLLIDFVLISGSCP